MDLNLDNYSLTELLTILHIKETPTNISVLQKSLYTKIEQVKTYDVDALPESKENLMEFYTKGFFKLLKNLAIINGSKEKNSSLITEYDDAYGKSVGNTYDESYHRDNLNKESISVKDKLLPPMMYNPVVQEGSKFATKHVDHGAVNTFNSHLKYGIVNPLTRKAFKKIININTRFRNNYTTSLSTNFSIFLPSPIKKVTSMKVTDTQFPKMVYTFSSTLGSNSFIVDSGIPGGPWTIVIPNGSYNSHTIVQTINSALALTPSNVVLSYNENNGLMTFTQTGGFDLSLNFNYNQEICPQLPSNINKDQVTLGWLLGFRGNYLNKITSTKSQYECLNMVKNQVDINNIYFGSSNYTGESIFDSHGSRYFLIAINDYQNNHNSIFISPFQNQTLADTNIMAKISTECCEGCCSHNPERIYFGPTDIPKLHITIYDEFGRIVDINNADYSLTLELELLYDL